MRRTARYFQSLAMLSAPLSVRAPQTVGPLFGKLRMQLTPSWFSAPFSGSVSVTLSESTPDSVASRPAGDFHTPRFASVRAITPATAPPGANGSMRLSCSGLLKFRRGKNIAAFASRLATLTIAPDAAAADASAQLCGASTSTKARRSSA